MHQKKPCALEPLLISPWSYCAARYPNFHPNSTCAPLDDHSFMHISSCILPITSAYDQSQKTAGEVDSRG